MKLSEFIEANLLTAIYKRCHPIKKDTIKAIFYGNKEYQKTKNPDAFEGILNTSEFCTEINDINEGGLLEALKELCRKYQSSKKTIITVSSELAEILKKRCNITIDLDVPSFQYDNAIERQLFLIKFLHHDEKHTLENACEYLWMYNREKIFDDINDIKKGLSFLGKSISLEIDKNNNEITSFPTGHPIILVENMSQIFVQLEGLRKMATGSTETYAKRTAATIWSQLSDYAKQRVFYVVEKLYESDAEFYHGLDKMVDTKTFFDEDSLSKDEGATSLLNYIKNGYDFYIAFKNNENNTVKKHSKFSAYNKSTLDTFCLIDLDTNQEFTVKESDVIACVRDNNEWFKAI